MERQQSEPEKGHEQKRRVQIVLESQSEGDRMERTAEGELFAKGSQLYLRYEEPEEAQMGRTVTTVRVQTDEIRVIRHGDVRFDQIFSIGRPHLGYMQTPHGRMELETRTDSLYTEGLEGKTPVIRLSWDYTLTVMGEEAGRYRVKLTAFPLT